MSKKTKSNATSTPTIVVRRPRAAWHGEQAGPAAITIREVAKRARVSIATVSRVLNNPRSVREHTRTRVQNAMRDLDYQPNLIASSLAKKHTGCIGLVIPNMGPVFAALIDEIDRTVHAEGHYLVIATGRALGQDPAHTVRFLRQRRCDALIMFPSTMNDAAVRAMMDEVPNLVLIHRLVEKHRQRCVMLDNRAGARQATRYLIDCGHRDIAVITGPRGNPESEERHAAFLDVMHDAGLSVDPRRIIVGDFSPAAGERGAAQLLASGARPSALFCFNDEMAAGAISYLRIAGISLPEDISIVGFDDVPYCAQLYPRLTTVRQPTIAIARAAARCALDLGNGRPLPAEPLMFQPELVIRDSVVRPRQSTHTRDAFISPLATPVV